VDAQIRKLRRELEAAHEKVNTLTTQLNTNVSTLIPLTLPLSLPLAICLCVLVLMLVVATASVRPPVCQYHSCSLSVCLLNVFQEKSVYNLLKQESFTGQTDALSGSGVQASTEDRRQTVNRNGTARRLTDCPCPCVCVCGCVGRCGCVCVVLDDVMC